MATRIPTPAETMRKAPRQARARATVEAMLDAAAHILGARGWAGITTNAVAETAGVSIGSLYQYFPNKLALVEAVRRRHLDEVLAVLRAAADLATSRGRRIAALVDGMIAVHGRYPAAHRVLLEEVSLGKDARADDRVFEAAYQRGYEAVFVANAPDAAARPRIASQVLAAAVAGTVHDAARQGTLSSPVFRLELIALVDSYLTVQQARG